MRNAGPTMPEWIPTRDGIPLKTTDAMLEFIRAQSDTIKALELELAMYRTIIPTGSDQPAHV